jgi:hypothetical protein
MKTKQLFTLLGFPMLNLLAGNAQTAPPITSLALIPGNPRSHSTPKFMKTGNLFALFLMFCVGAALVGCASTDRQVSASPSNEQNLQRAEAPASPALLQHATLDENAFRKLDRNSDGTLTLEEWQHFDKSAGAKENFSMLDGDGDGQINFPEFLKQAPKHSERYHFLGKTGETDDSYVSSGNEVFEQPGWQLFSFHF